MSGEVQQRTAASMVIRPAHIPVGALLSTVGTFQVPRYQRNYAWRIEEVSALLKDLDLCRVGRDNNQRRHHFFGGVVTAFAPVPGSARQNHELIDGQQRLATFLMLLMQLKQAMLALAVDIAEENPPIVEFLKETGDILTSRYDNVKDTIDLTVVTVPRLQLSLPDEDYFNALLRGAHPPAERKSHIMLAEAFDAIGAHIAAIVAAADGANTKAKALETIMHVIEQDWTVIHMAAQDRIDAYMLFQVLNDRGMNLTEGELLRASTLEALAPIAPAAEMKAVEQSWDNILAGKDVDVRAGLKWIYASQIGDWPGKATLLSDLTQNLFPDLNGPDPLTRAQGDAVTKAVSSLERDFGILTQIWRGDWPVAESQAICAWQRDRLRLLVVHLKQVDCLPLLIAATLLNPAVFSEVVQALERFCFRYSIMVEASTLEAVAVYNRHAVDIRRAPADYKIGTLMADLRDLLERNAPDDVFRSRLSELRYPRSESKKPLKYFLMTLEHYVRWYDEGAQGRPVCRDLMRVLDFENATIEHIYAENAAALDPDLEPLVDTLGNLTILSPKENDAAGDKPFDAKRPYLEKSTSTLNNQIAKVAEWNLAAVEQRQEHLIEMGISVFSL